MSKFQNKWGVRWEWERRRGLKGGGLKGNSPPSGGDGGWGQGVVAFGEDGPLFRQQPYCNEKAPDCDVIDVLWKGKEGRKGRDRQTENQNEYVKAQLKTHEADPRKFWNAIKAVWSPKNSSGPIVSLVDPATNCQIDDAKVPETFNHHLCTVGQKRSQKFAHAPPFMRRLQEVADEFYLNEITCQEVRTLVDKIKITKSSAIEGLTLRVLKDAFEVLLEQLALLFNTSIETGTFPDKWKMANVILLHKAQEKTNVNNYRPISLLPLPGKLLESVIYKRLYSYLENNNLLTKKQWGFRTGRSTLDASSDLVETILSNLNSKMHACRCRCFIH